MGDTCVCYLHSLVDELRKMCVEWREGGGECVCVCVLVEFEGVVIIFLYFAVPCGQFSVSLYQSVCGVSGGGEGMF
jgi:hypothetical protein